MLLQKVELSRRLRSAPKWIVGVAIATPSLAMLQGVLMLREFRTHHSDAPMPVSPSRGIVVVKSEAQQGQQQQPLRLLVIGDSLAAGVGVSKHGTPILPESIAKALSQNLGGRAVRWTCVGRPGASASQIVHDIFSLQREPNLLETKLLEWQITKRRAEEWLEDRKKKKGDENDDLPEAVGNSRIRRWFSNVKRDIKSFRSHVLTKSDPRLVHELLRNQQTSLKARRMSNVDSNEYDIAVVLTGLNDLKDMCLPFMTRGANSGTTDEAREQASNDGIKGELMRVLAALKERMRLPEAVQNTTGMKDQGPLVVFPALPTSPMPLCHSAPLSWFVVPLLDMIDNHKKRLAESFPNLVLFVEPPSLESLEDMEAGRGPIFNSRKAEQVLLEMTDVTKKAKERVEVLMRKHYQQLTNDRERGSEETQDVYHQGCHDHLPASAPSPTPGSTLMAVDNVHPNDEGYDFWGRHIAAAIVTEWKTRNETTLTPIMQKIS
jgi:lysophospholipase L1-like esterase